MADSDLEIDVVEEDGVEVQTIIQGQAPISGGEDDLEFMVQEEVETTTDGDGLAVELDPVDNVIIALQQSDHSLGTGGHFDLKSDDQNGGLEVGFSTIHGGLSLAKRKRDVGSRGLRGGVSSKRKQKKNKKGSIRFVNRQIPAALSGAGVAKEAAREANEASFDPEKEPRKWKKSRIPVKTMDGGKFTISMWSSGRFKIQPPGVTMGQNELCEINS